MSALKVSGLLSACALGLMALSGTARAENGIGGSWHVFAPGKPACPNMLWHFRVGNGQPYGYIWFADASGISRATGTIDEATGVFHLTVVPIDGKGPAGVVDGTRNPNGTVEATMKGEGCSNLTISHPQMINESVPPAVVK